MQRIQGDFDRLAQFDDEGWTHNRHYEAFLLKHLPADCRDICEVGCGTGSLARLLAGRAEQVLALDLSPEMIRIAQERSAGFSNIDYQLADVSQYPFQPEQFDAIFSVATAHHLDLEGLLMRLKAALRPGGVVAILDLYKSETVADYLTSMMAIPANIVLNWMKNGAVRQPESVRKLWDEHGKYDVYLSLAEVRAVSQAILPGAVVRRHLLWRYSLIWKKAA